MKPVIKHIVLLFILALSAGGTMAQTDSKKEKIDALRVAFIKKQVSFTEQEAIAFWPLYNEMNDRLDAYRLAFRKQYPATANYNFATDREAEAYLNAELFLKQKEYELSKEYFEKFKKVLPVKKVVSVRRAEEDFKKELIKIVKEN
jgi:hypothetical protein